MLQKFSKDHKYKFSKEQVKKDFGEEHFESCMNNNPAFKSLVNYCDGKYVEVESETKGWIEDRASIHQKYPIIPQWCICVGRND